MKFSEAVGAALAAPCGVVCAAPLSLMYSSMHPLGGVVNRVERKRLNFFSWECVRGGFSGLRSGVLRVLLRWRRGADGRFCCGIPGFLGGARARRGDSAHGGQRRALGAKKFLKIFKKGVENLKIGVREVPEGGLGTPYIRYAGRFWVEELSQRSRGTSPLAALLEVCISQAPQL